MMTFCSAMSEYELTVYLLRGTGGHQMRPGGLLGRAQAQDRGLRNMDKSVEGPRLFLKPEIYIGPGGRYGHTFA